MYFSQEIHIFILFANSIIGKIKNCMKAQEILDRIEYKPECHHCFSEEEVVKAMKKYAKQKCKEQIELYKEYLKENKHTKGEVPYPDFD